MTVLVPALSITKTADAGQVVATGSVGYTIQATNTGQADYPAATLTDSLAGVLDDPELGKPEMAIWTSSAPSWAVFEEGLPQEPKQPPPVKPK